MKKLIFIIYLITFVKLLFSSDFDNRRRRLEKIWKLNYKRIDKQYEHTKKNLNNRWNLLCDLETKFDDNYQASNYFDIALLNRLNNVDRYTIQNTKTSFAEYKDLITKYAVKYQILPELISSLIKAESFFYPYAVSQKNAVGIMQLLPSTANEVYFDIYGKKGYINTGKLFDVETNIDLGCGYLKKLNNIFNYLPYKQKRLAVIASYNCGPYRVKRIIDNNKLEIVGYSNFYKILNSRLPDETKKYVSNVLKNLKYFNSEIF